MVKGLRRRWDDDAGGGRKAKQCQEDFLRIVPCQYGADCTVPNCKLRHPANTRGLRVRTHDSSVSPPMPEHLMTCDNLVGQIKFEGGMKSRLRELANTMVENLPPGDQSCL